ncbi:hypothetical protein J1N35_035371 [Gossypium stocksii]|uniref:Reverse transcriptase zinc-binding domain-containing protein n=1 Tax=Gossypium stocksii TaxID=47602 RepID=A0A9D3ZQ38_9ROSI|nr:hypothetical protein J1N35_035371 [Gossypium stocksii]
MLNHLKEVVSSKVLVPEEEDRLMWIHDNKGVFSVKKLTELLIKEGMDDICFTFDKIWKLKVPPRMKSFLWMVSIDRLPTKEFLIRRGVQIWQLESGCPWCGQNLMDDFGYSGMLIGVAVGCGGVLRDSDGVARALFSSLVEAKDSISAEMGASIIALDVFSAMGCKGKSSLIIEFGSNEVFYWFKNKGLKPWLLRPIFKEIEHKMVRVGNVSFSKADKNRNEMAYALAVVGIKRPAMFKAWW